MTHTEISSILSRIDELLRQLPGNRIYERRPSTITSIPSTLLPWGWTLLQPWYSGQWSRCAPAAMVLAALETAQNLEDLDRLTAGWRSTLDKAPTPGYHPGCHHYSTYGQTDSQVPSVANVLSVMEAEACSQEDAVLLLGGVP